MWVINHFLEIVYHHNEKNMSQDGPLAYSRTVEKYKIRAARIVADLSNSKRPTRSKAKRRKFI
jgi:hypothetical protein